MKFHIITLFPEFFVSPMIVGLLGKAISKGMISVNLYRIEDEKQIDDRPYGGGPGMVIRIEPVVNALRRIELKGKSIKILLSPGGELLTQELVDDISKFEEIVLVCGRYEGIDARILNYVDKEISIGDYVLHSGDTAALVLLEAVSRKVEGFMTTPPKEEISVGLLSYPQYTRPREFEGLSVPEILLSGDHEKIRMWRIRKAVEKTVNLRKDLIVKFIGRMEENEKKYFLNILNDDEKLIEKLSKYIYRKKIL